MPTMLSRVLMASSAGLYPKLPGSGTRRAGTRKRRPPRPPKRRASSKRKRGGRLVKGSAAAKAYMAKIRRKRRR